MGNREEGAALACPKTVNTASRLPKPALAWPAVPPQLRRQPIRDALLAYLQTPRVVADIARHIGRPVPTTTGHLAAMRRLGLVKRLDYAVYAVAGYDGPVPAWQRPRLSQSASVRTKVRAALCHPTTFPDLVRVTGLSEHEVRQAVNALWMAGLVKGDEATGYQPMGALLQQLDDRPSARGAGGTPPNARRHATKAVRTQAG